MKINDSILLQRFIIESIDGKLDETLVRTGATSTISRNPAALSHAVKVLAGELTIDRIRLEPPFDPTKHNKIWEGTIWAA